MSEYTNYYIIKSSSQSEVQKRLNEAKIHSILSTKWADHWCTEAYKDEVHSKWVLVTAPADRGFKQGSYFHDDKFQDLCKLFGTVIWFFEEENTWGWSIEIKHGTELLSKKLHPDKKIRFSSEEQRIMEKVFDKPFARLFRYLKPRTGGDFLSSNGIMYIQMNDQDHVELNETINGNYAIFDYDLPPGF